MSIIEEFQKVTNAYRALGYDDHYEGDEMVRDFLEEYTGLEYFANQGEHESEEIYLLRVKNTLSELTPLVGNIPEKELSGFFHYAYMDASYCVADYSRPDVLALAIGNFILNGIPNGVSGYFNNNDNRKVTLDFLIEDAPMYIQSIIGHLKDLINEIDEMELKAPLKALKEGLITGTPIETTSSNDESGKLFLSDEGTQTLGEAFAGNAKLIKHLKNLAPSTLDFKYVTNLWGSKEPRKGDDAIIFTNSQVLIVASGFGGWLNSGSLNDVFIPNEKIDHLSLGTAHHVQYSGFTSADENYWTVAIVTVDGAVYERYIALGTNEKDMNHSRQRLTHTFEYLANFFAVTVDGGHAESSDGYTTSIGYGVWQSL